MKQIRIIFLLWLLSGLGFKTQAQVVASQAIDSLVIKAIEKNKESNTVPGFRIQVFNGNSQNEAEEVKKWLQEFDPELFVVLVYQAPNFKVKVGNFRRRVDGQKLLQIVQEKYPSAFMVPDKINP